MMGEIPVTGLDTGFFVMLLGNDDIPVGVWKSIIDGEESVVSCLTLFELRRLAYKGGIDRESADVLIEGIGDVCTVAWLDDVDILEQAARLSHGLGIPVIDSLILASFNAYGADVVYTTDSHMESFGKKGIKIVRL